MICAVCLSSPVTTDILWAQGAAQQDTLEVKEPAITYAGIGIGGFIPMREGYRINYSTDLGGLPIEVMGLIQFPITPRTLPQLGIRFTRRSADFVAESEVQMMQLEPGIRYMLQPAILGQTEDGSTMRELGLYTGVFAQMSRTTVYGEIEETSTGFSPIKREVSKDYYNLGIGLDLGLTYPLTKTTFIDGGVHVTAYLNDPVRLGGLGNIGGVSFNVAYRFGF